MNPFENYSKRANMIARNHPTPLIGPIKTRRAALARYNEIAAELRSCRDRCVLQTYLTEITADLLQFHAELDFLWHGDGNDFLGLEREIESAFETVEAAQYFRKFDSFRRTESEAWRSPGQ